MQELFVVEEAGAAGEISSACALGRGAVVIFRAISHEMRRGKEKEHVRMLLFGS